MALIYRFFRCLCGFFTATTNNHFLCPNCKTNNLYPFYRFLEEEEEEKE